MLSNEIIEFERFTKTEKRNSRRFSIWGYAIVFIAVFFIAAGEARADSGAVIQADGVSLMAAAISDNHPEIVTRLINAGVDVNAALEDGFTVLMHAAMAGNPEIVTALIAAGADLDAVDSIGYTALMIAALHDVHPDVTIMLLNAGADARIRNNAGETALDIARDNTYLANSEAFRRLYEASF